GEKAQRKLMRAIDEQAAFHGFGDEGSTVNGELDADHEAFAADFFKKGIFGGQFLDATANFGAARDSVGENFCFVQYFQEFEGDSANHRATTERCTVNARADAESDCFRCQDGSERQTSR